MQSSAFEKLFEHTQEDVIGKSIVSLFANVKTIIRSAPFGTR